MSRWVRNVFGIVLVLAAIAGPIVYAVHQGYQMKNFRVVREGVLYRSGQMTRQGLERVLHDYGIRTVVTLRDARAPGKPPPDLAEQRFCEKADIKYVRIPPRSWDAPDTAAPAEEGLRTFRAVMSDPDNYPVLVHCCAGIHRTGAFCAVYRMEFEHWTNERALAEMRACGYTNLDNEWDILDYLEAYRPAWKDRAEGKPAAKSPHHGRMHRHHVGP
jgi:tyrosine-protein phosphatase SIW14